MKKFKFIFIGIVLFTLTGCLKNDSMEDITIVTSNYPIEYVISKLYGSHSLITSIYPKDDNINKFKVTDTLLKQYSDYDLFIFNGLSEENKYVKKLLKENEELKIIDVASNINYENNIEELWLDPNNLLTIANNIRKGFKEYIKSTYLTNEIDENYENLKLELTSLDGKQYSTAKNSRNKTIIVADDSFLFLEKYGINIISIDPDTAKEKIINEAKTLLKNKTCNYLFIKYKDGNKDIKEFISENDVEVIELFGMDNLKEIDVEKTDYITLMNQNLENIKLELYR